MRRAFGIVLVVCVLCIASAPIEAASTAPKAFPGGSHFVLECRFAQRNNDDPIVFPGRPGLSHNHTYIGNFFVDASTTPESLLDGRSSCDFDADSSAYWAPTLLVGLRPVPLITGFVYYVKRTTAAVVPLPAGLKMIAGNSMALRPQPKRVVSWACGDEVGDAPRFAAIPRCATKSILEFQVVFPNCWNGTSLDSDNHRRHMTYSTAGSCPASHPVAVPTIILVLLYDKTPQQARLSAGQFALHADFMNGWDQPTLARLVASLN